ncbi:MAG: hypothetical protein NTZ74_04650 [Chloroflexi bacterium]|nr:hypothetical protein [Chloroflexota bacterium]
MDKYFEPCEDYSDLEHLKFVMDFHFGEFYGEVGVSLDDHPMLHASAVIEYLIYYRGNDWRMQEKLHFRYPAAILEILEHKSHKESEYIEVT